MTANPRILDFRNRPSLPPYAQLFEIKRDLLGSWFKRTAAEWWFRWMTGSLTPLVNRGARTTTPSMQTIGQPDALAHWWREIDAAGIDAVCSPGRLSEDRGSIDAATLAKLQAEYPQRFYGLAPVNLEQDAALTVAECERAVRELGLRGVNLEPAIRQRGGPSNCNNPDFYPIYEAMAALDAVVMLYTGPFAGRPVDLSNNMADYDAVLSRFPKLTMVIGHGGYPRIPQVLETMRKHRNFHVCPDIYAFWPGGQQYLREIDKLQDQFVFGTAYPFSSMAEPVEETLKLPLGATAREKYLVVLQKCWCNEF